MEEESIVHGQLVQSEQEQDSDGDSINSRLSLVENDHNVDIIAARGVRVDVARRSDFENCEMSNYSNENRKQNGDFRLVNDDPNANVSDICEENTIAISNDETVKDTDFMTDNEETLPYSCNNNNDVTDSTHTRTDLVDNDAIIIPDSSVETINIDDIYTVTDLDDLDDMKLADNEGLSSDNEGLSSDSDQPPLDHADVILVNNYDVMPGRSQSKSFEENCFRILPDIPDICNFRPASSVELPPECTALDITDINLVDNHLDNNLDRRRDSSDGDQRPGSVGHLLELVRALANNLPSGPVTTATSAISGSGLINLGFEDNESVVAEGRMGEESDESSNEDIDWSWLADEAQLCSTTSRPSSWLRASMRRVRRFALGEPTSLPTTIVPARHSAPNEPSRCHTLSHPPNSAIPDILNSVSRCSVRASCAMINRDPPPVVDDVPAVSSLLLTPSAPPESPIIPRDPDDFPRRYSLLGRIDQQPGQETDEPPEQPSEPTTEDESNSECDDSDEKEDCWPHSLSSVLASLGCTLGLFNVSRFAILSVHFGANFVIQFLVLTAVIGWPLYVFNASLGQHLKAGVVDMWRISPLFQGIGVALLLAQAMLGLYSVVGVAWLFTYFRDSFINKFDAYRWAENGTKIEESVSYYLNTVVLQRQGSSTVGHLKFQVTFNLAVVWMIVFVCLSKGIKSYGKSVYLFGTLPILCIIMLTIKMLSITDVWFDHTAWNELFVNGNCWTAAAIECFTTWGLLGAATMQMRSHSASCRLPREVLAVGAVTIATLVSAALLANGFSQILRSNDLRYMPSSFEHKAVFLSPVDAPRQSSTPVRWMSHGHHIVGLQVTVPGAVSDSSGYQVAQFATELAPAVFAKLGPQVISPFWTVLFYFTLIMLGISQQLCIWHCVITGVMAINISRLRSWETTITFLSCACGFVLGLPMTTELGVVVVYFMDYCVGGAWWLILLQAAQIVAALMAQGGEQVAHSLLGNRRPWLQAILVFTWNVVLPISFTVVSVSWFKTNNYRDLYSSRNHGYWPAWARRVGCLVQLVPLIIVPLVSAIQTWRYLTNGPPDLFDRLRLLCRPGSSALSVSSTTPTVSAPSQSLPELSPFDDPPPKYTPPPSYATATGARIAKLLRRSFRRLVGPSAPSPPDYSAVLVEMGGPQIAGRTSTLSAMEVAHILRSSMRRTLRREHTRSAPSTAQDSSKTAPVI